MGTGSERPWWLRLRGVPSSQLKAGARSLSPLQVRVMRLYPPLTVVLYVVIGLLSGEWLWTLWLILGPLLVWMRMPDHHRTQLLGRR